MLNIIDPAKCLACTDGHFVSNLTMFTITVVIYDDSLYISYTGAFHFIVILVRSSVGKSYMHIHVVRCTVAICNKLLPSCNNW